MKRALICFAALLTSTTACSTTESAKTSFRVAFHAQTDDGAPLEGVTMTTGKSKLGETDAGGDFTVRLTGAPGATLLVGTQCPEGYESPPDDSLRLTEVKALGDNESRPLEYSSTCIRQVRDMVVVVHAEEGSNLPVIIDGHEQGRTDQLGNAVVALKVDRDVDKVSVSLDTSAQPHLRPTNPTQVFAPEGRDAIAVFDQVFTEAKPARRRVQGSSAPRRHVPYRMN